MTQRHFDIDALLYGEYVERNESSIDTVAIDANDPRLADIPFAEDFTIGQIWEVDVLAYDSDGLNPSVVERKQFTGSTAEPDAEVWSRNQIARFHMPVKCMVYTLDEYNNRTFRRPLR